MQTDNFHEIQTDLEMSIESVYNIHTVFPAPLTEMSIAMGTPGTQILISKYDSPLK